jgi:hypothetical protein
MKTYIAAMAFMACVLMALAGVPNVAADSVVWDTDMHGTYSDGTVWNVLVPATMTVSSNATHVESVYNALTAYYDDFNGTYVNQSVDLYIYYQWKFEGVVVQEYWPTTYFPIQDNSWEDPANLYIEDDLTNWSSDGKMAFEFDRGYGHYTVSVIFLQTSFDGYYSISFNNATFYFANPATALAVPEIMIGGVIGFLFMALAFPAMVVLVKSGRWISGIGALVIMLLIGWTCFVLFVLNSGAF